MKSEEGLISTICEDGDLDVAVNCLMSAGRLPRSFARFPQRAICYPQMIVLRLSSARGASVLSSLRQTNIDSTLHTKFGPAGSPARNACVLNSYNQ